MSEPEAVLYDEPGSGAAPLLWGPGFALAGYLFELATGARTHALAWVLIGLVLLVMTAVWVYARRRFLAVRVTGRTLWQGREQLAVTSIGEFDDVGAPAGARVLGGGWSVPRKYHSLPLRLDDGTVVLAWARDPERLRSALREAIAA